MDRKNAGNEGNERIREEQRELIHLIGRIKRLHPQIKDCELNQGDLNTMIAIGHEMRDGDYVRVSDIVQALPVPPPAVSRSLRNLELKGYTQRSADPSDRRNTLVRLTEKGWKKCGQCRAQMDQFFRGIFLRMGRENVRMLLDSLTRLVDAAEAEKAEHCDSCDKGKGDENI